MWTLRSLTLRRKEKARRTSSRRRWASGRMLRLECLESRTLLSAAPEVVAAELPEDANTSGDYTQVATPVLDNLTRGDSAVDGSVAPELNGLVQPDAAAARAANDLATASPASIVELKADADGLLRGRVLGDALRACRRVEVDVDGNGAADLYTYTNESDAFGCDLGDRLGEGTRTVQARTGDASGDLDGGWQTVTFERRISPDAGITHGVLRQSHAPDAVPDLVHNLCDSPLTGVRGRLRALTVTTAEGEALPGPPRPPAPPPPPGGGVSEEQSAPVITAFTATAGSYGTWYFEGTVEHEAPWTLHVDFGGLFTASIGVQVDGSFSYSKAFPSGTNGMVTAQAFDPDGIGSNVAYDWVIIPA